MQIGLQVKYMFFLLDFNEASIFYVDFRKILVIKFYENPSSGRLIFPWRHTNGRTDRHDVDNCFSQFFEHA